MSSHQDRVRRNYHNIKLIELEDITGNEQIINIRITKADIASRISQRDLEYLVIKKIKEEIKRSYKE